MCLCGKLTKATDGTKDAAQNVQWQCSEMVRELGSAIARGPRASSNTSCGKCVDPFMAMTSPSSVRPAASQRSCST